MKLSDILSSKDFYCKSNSTEVEIKKISTSFEITGKDTLFVSLKGDKDAEAAAIKSGCAAILCDVENRDYSIPVIHTQNLRIAYAELCFQLSGFDRTKTKLIGVTGTNGKTSVARTI